MPKLSLCSYTYNDAPLLHGLLADIPAWTVQPDEIVLVDDGSDVPFVLEGDVEKSLPVRLIRLEQNAGFPRAKHTGLSAAGGDILLSLDCDSRVEPHFAEVCIERLRDPKLGMVSGCSGITLRKDMVSSYLNVFGDVKLVEQPETVDFISGVGFALRREVWEQAGGMAAFGGAVCEDHHLSAAVRGLGLTLLLDPRINVSHTRILTRHAATRRVWTWCGAAWLKQPMPALSLPEFYLAYFLTPSLERCAIIAERFPRVWLYLELLLICSFALEFCNGLSLAGRIPPETGQCFLHELKARLKAFPALFSLLKADLLKAGSLPARQGPPPPVADTSRLATVAGWDIVLDFLDTFEQNGTLRWLNSEGLAFILDDEAHFTADFSSYTQSNPGP